MAKKINEILGPPAEVEGGVKRHVRIDEKDNGYVMELSAGSMYKELVEKSLPKTLKMIAAFLKDEISEGKEEGTDEEE